MTVPRTFISPRTYAGRAGETRSRSRRKDFPHDLELDPTDAIRQPKEEQLAGRYVGACVR